MDYTSLRIVRARMASRNLDADTQIASPHEKRPGHFPQASSLLGYLEDDSTRCFLDVMSGGWCTVQELTDRCETPLSTTYRKISALEDAGLLLHREQLAASGQHVNEYRAKRLIVTMRIGEPNGVELGIHPAPLRSSRAEAGSIGAQHVADD